MNLKPKSFASVFVVAITALAIGACSSKKKADDANSPDGMGGAPMIESTAMNFDAQGSDSGSIAGLSTVNFEYDRAAITSTGRRLIAANVEWMKARPNVNVQVEGHCDSRGSIEYNLALGERRAKAVRDYMVSLGIPAGRLSIISYGKEKLLAQGDSEADHVRNRRANFLPLQ